MEHRAKIVGVALLCVAFGSDALTLGRVRGAALVGQPLDIVVPVQMDAGDDASSLCFDAEVFHADTRQDPNRVRVVVETTAQPNAANVRILSLAIVDEPVVTVYLRTGCGQKTTRRYVLLADLQSEVAPPAAPLVVPASAPAKLDMIPAAPVAIVKAKTVQVPKKIVRGEDDSTRTEAKAAVASPRGAKSGKKSKAEPSGGQSRLKLDPLELLSDRVANLDADMTFTPPEDALHHMQKTQALEGDVKALRALAAKNEASLVDLKSRLQKSESERFPGGVIYGLIALMLACLAAVALLWTRQRRGPTGHDDWWSGSIATPASAETEPESPPRPAIARNELGTARASEQIRPGAIPGVLRDSGHSSEVDVSLMEMSQSNFDDLMRSGAARNASRKQPPQPSPAGVRQARPARSLSSATMTDIRQQAEFFLSLGQTDQAVKILKKQIDESDEPNPFVCLDLLNIFHSLSLKIDFQLLREDFNRLFSGRVPEFSFFKDEGKGLESYPDALSHITALWPTPKVLDVLEAYIIRAPRDAKNQSFDLAAFRDLLLLHAVGQSIGLVLPQGDREPRAGSASISTVSAGTPRDATVPGYRVPAPSSGPDQPISVQPDLSLEEIGLPRVLDLDLSDSEMAVFASGPVSTAGVDVPLPLLMPGDYVIDGQDEGATRPLDNGNLVDFDLPEAPKRPGPAGN